MPKVASTCVKSAGPPPVSKYTELKSPKVQIIDKIVEVKYKVCIDGQVMNLNFCQELAPSTEAASYCSAGMDMRPASKIKVQKGKDFQMCMSMAKVIANVVSLSQLGPSKPVSWKICVLITPHSGLSMKRPDKMVGIDGRAQGKMNNKDKPLIHHLLYKKKPDKTIAMAIFTLMATTKKTKVFTAVRKNIGSSNNLT